MVSAAKHEYIGVVGLQRKELLNLLGEFRDDFSEVTKSELIFERQIYQMNREERK